MSGPESEQSLANLSPEEAQFLMNLSKQYGTPVQSLVAQLHRNVAEAQMVAAVEGITVEDFYLRRIAEIQAQLEEFD